MATGHDVHSSSGGTPARANRLAQATSPYLLQHQHNPVDWYEWGPEPIERARRENKPIFLSIGYSACHWCHVMAHEVFEDPAIADLMNQYFINIKVDREERPDLDELYMLATQLMTGSGGWPMSVWLTPELTPFYAGTYFPPVDGYGRPGFPRLTLALAEAWRTRPESMRAQAAKVVDAVKIHADEMSRAGENASVDLAAWCRAAVESSLDRFDPQYGGFGKAPKFPPHQSLMLWLTMLRNPNTAGLSAQAASSVRDMLIKTLDGMMRGGIYDHVGGGFARYSVDEFWLVPHFEKMLYDNAQLAPVYALAGTQLGRPDYIRIARQTLDFWLREMTSADGGFYSALDADSEGHEGKFYVWTPGEVREALRHPDESQLIIEHFGLSDEGNFEGRNVLAIAVPVETLAQKRGVSVQALQAQIDAILVKLRQTRAARVPPGLDDKVLTGWSGLMISALAMCGRVLKEPRYLEAAHKAMGFILMRHVEGGRRLLRASRNSKAHVDAFLEDHAYLLNAMQDLVDATSPTSLPGTMARKRALEMADVMVRDFADAAGGFFSTSRTHDELFARLKQAADNATPSANGMAIRALLRLAQASGRETYHETAMHAVRGFAPVIKKNPGYFATILQSLIEDAEFQVSRPKIGGGAVAEVAPDIDLHLPVTVSSDDAGSGAFTVDVPPTLKVAPGGSFELPVTLRIAASYHVQPHQPNDPEAFATVARLRGSLPLGAQEWSYPAPAQLDDAGHPVSGYAGDVQLLARCVVTGDVPPGQYDLRVTVLAQPCGNGRCLPPEKVTAVCLVTVG